MSDDFDLPEPIDAPFGGDKLKADPMRPEAVRGRYPLPHPVTGKMQTWQRTSTLIKMCEDTFHLDKWKQRTLAKGLAMRPDYVDAVKPLDVKADKERLNKICERAQEIAGAYKMSDEGTALHLSSEIMHHASGSLEGVPDRHKVRMQQYLDALAVNGLAVTPGMIERVIVSTRYEVAGKFDLITTLADGTHAVTDLKTSDSLDLSFPSITGQLAAYGDGINSHGVWDGTRYDDSIKVRDDFGLVIHLPSTRDEVTVYRVDLASGRLLNELCVQVRARRRVKAKQVAETFQPAAYGVTSDSVDQVWLEAGNAAHTVTELMAVADRARGFSQWNQRLSDQFRIIAGEIQAAEATMGS